MAGSFSSGPLNPFKMLSAQIAEKYVLYVFRCSSSSRRRQGKGKASEIEDTATNAREC